MRVDFFLYSATAMPTHLSSSPAATEALAASFAATLAAGDCVALLGDLGAGKTNFTRGLVAGLGGDRRDVSSPTYVLLQIYESPAMRLPVYHLDAYRVGGADDLEAIGFSELLAQGGVVVVEWADRVADLLPAGVKTVRLTATGRSTRRVDLP